MRTDALVGVFDSDHALLSAARAAKAAGLPARDAYTPFPVHGMDEALGLPPSWLSKACGALACLGLTAALGFEYWVSVFDWPMNIGGKPFDASPALIPVAFEITVLVAGVGTVVILLLSRGLLPGREPALADLRATDDRFLLAFEAAGDDAARVRALLKEHGALEVRS